MDKQDRKELKEIVVATLGYSAFVAVTFGALGLIAGCDGSYTPSPGQATKACIALDGTDRFILDPNDDATRVMRLSGVFYVEFTDKLTGLSRVVKAEDMVRYACKEVRHNG